MRLLLLSLGIAALVWVGQPLADAARAQAPGSPPTSLTVVSAAGRRPLRTTTVNGRDMVALDDLAALFQLSMREDTLAGALTVSYKGKSIVVMPDQAIASIQSGTGQPGAPPLGGRLVSLPAPVVHEAKRWLAPIEFIPRALALIYDARLDYRPASRLIVVGILKVPRLTVEQEVQGNQARLTFETTPKTQATVTPEQGRLVVRFDADALDTTLPAAAAPGLAESLRLVEPGNAVAIQLGPRFASFGTSTSPGDTARGRLFIDLLPALPGAGPTSPLAPAPLLPPLSELPQAGQGLRLVAIDPGHGGHENGARGATGMLEKDVALDVARRLRGLLEGRLGVRALMTRDGDGAVTADERAAMANNNKADLFVSIHANASLNKEVKGATIFQLDPASYALPGTAEPVAAGPTTLPLFSGGTREIAVVSWETAQTLHLADSQHLASIVEETMRGRVPLAARPIRRAPLRVLVGANMPAVLVEVAFLSNAEQEQALGSGELQNAVAQTLFDAIVRFANASRAVQSTSGDGPYLGPRDERRRSGGTSDARGVVGVPR